MRIKITKLKRELLTQCRNHRLPKPPRKIHVVRGVVVGPDTGLFQAQGENARGRLNSVMVTWSEKIIECAIF